MPRSCTEPTMVFSNVANFWHQGGSTLQTDSENGRPAASASQVTISTPQDEPRLVYYRWNLLDLWDVSPETSRFSAKFYIELVWADDRKEGEKHWKPDIFFPDQIGEPLAEDYRAEKELAPEDEKKFGRKMRRYGIVAHRTLKQQFDIRRFPFDKHQLLIKVRSRAAERRDNTRQVVWLPNTLMPSTSAPDARTLCAYEMWDFKYGKYNMTPRKDERTDEEKDTINKALAKARQRQLDEMKNLGLDESEDTDHKRWSFVGQDDPLVRTERVGIMYDLNRKRPAKLAFPAYLTEVVHELVPTTLHSEHLRFELVLLIKISRKKAYHVFNVLLPMNLITLLSGTAWTSHHCDVDVRLANSLVMVLTLVAFKFSLGPSAFPQVSYFTLMDKMFIFDLMIIVAVVAEVSVVYLYQESHGSLCSGEASEQERLQRWPRDIGAAATITAIWGLGQLWFFCHIIALRHGRVSTYLSKKTGADKLGVLVEDIGAEAARKVSAFALRGRNGPQPAANGGPPPQPSPHSSLQQGMPRLMPASPLGPGLSASPRISSAGQPRQKGSPGGPDPNRPNGPPIAATQHGTGLPDRGKW